MPMPFKTKIAGIYLGVPHLPGTKIVHICSESLRQHARLK